MNGMNDALNLFAITFSFISTLISLCAIILVLAQRWSTHKIEWKPLEVSKMEEVSKMDDELSVEEELQQILSSSRKKQPPKDPDPLEEVFESSNF